MAKAVLAGFPGSSNLGTTTAYMPFSGGIISTVEAYSQLRFRHAGTLAQVSIIVRTNTRNGTSTMRSRVNGANGNQSASIGPSTTGVFVDTSNTDTISDGDLANVSVTIGGTTGAISASIANASFEASSNTVTIISARNDGNYSTGNTTTYRVPTTWVSTTEASAQQDYNGSFTVSDLGVYVSANARTSATVIASRKNGSDGGMSVSIGSGATGLFEDNSNTDSLVAGDLFCYRMTTGNTGTEIIVIRSVKAEFESTADEYILISGLNASESFDTSALYYGVANAPLEDATEADVQSRVSADGRIKLLRIHVVTNNSTSGGGTVRVRKNGADSAMVVSVIANVTGFFEDAVNEEDIAVGDLINHSGIKGSTGNFFVRSFLMIIDTPPPFEEADSSRVAELTGSIDVNDARSAELHGEASATDSRATETHGELADDDARDSEITGQVLVNDSRAGETHGVDTANDARSAEVHGQDFDNDSRSAELEGIESANDSRSAELEGVATSLDSRASELEGVDTDSDIRVGEIHGELATDDSRGAELEGVDTSNDSRDSEMTGVATVNDSRSVELHGENDAQDSRGSEMHGVLTDSSEIDAELNGEAPANAQRASEMHGVDTDASERGAETNGGFHGSSTRGAQLYGPNPYPYCPDDSPYAEKESPYADADSPYTNADNPYEPFIKNCP